MLDASAVTTFLFTDIEGSTRLWEREPERMHEALACHDAIARASVVEHHGFVVKMVGDGVHAAFADPLDALRAVLQLQLGLAEPDATSGLDLRVRCGLHAGVDVRRDNDFYGNAVNRAARIMSVAHGGQILLSQTVAELIGSRLPGQVTLQDLGPVRLRDLAHPERIYQVVHPRLREKFPTLRSLEATPNNLPQQLTSFIGREREVADVRQQLAATRLLTLQGIGGLGKSRLSLEVAAEALEEFPDGVWFVELAPVSDARLVPQTMASVLGVKEEAGRPVTDALVKFVRDRELLIVLDNCEHLVQACAELARLVLESGPRVKILASSREHLNIAGERIFQLSPLAAPAPQQKLPRAVLLQFAAVRLFVERATAAQPAFALNDSNSTAVVEICNRLDGIPLAIELAAARVRAMSVDSIMRRLVDRFRLLGGGDRTAVPRQQTLRALIDWSYDLLEPAEQVLFGRLAVFAGGFRLDAAECVGAGDGLAEGDVIEHLTRLVEKSLIVHDAGGDRYRMLETMRQYALERLAESGNALAVRELHLAFYLGFAELARPELLGPEQGAWLARLDLERENLSSAHAWCDHAREGGAQGLRLVRSLRFYWFKRGLLGLGRRVTMEALARPDARFPDLLRCRVLSDAGQLTLYMAQYSEAQELLEESLAIARELCDQSRVAAVLQPLGMASLGRGDMATARAHLDEAVSLAQTLGNRREIAAALSALAQLHRAEGVLDKAEPLYTQALAIARDLDDRESIAIGLLNLAMVAIGRGNAPRAQHMLLQVMTIAAEIGSKPAGQCAIEVTAGLAAMAAQWTQAARFWGAAEHQAGETGIRRDAADEAFLAPLIDRARKAMGPQMFEAAEETGKELPFDGVIAEARRWLESSF